MRKLRLCGLSALCIVLVVAFCRFENVEGIEQVKLGATNSNDTTILNYLVSHWPQMSAIWNVSTDPCETAWKGLTCVQIDKEFRVVSLTITQMNLTGELPSEILELSALTDIALYGNELSGAIDGYEFNILTNLQSIILFENQFVGPLPRALPASLTSLDVSDNQFVGEIYPEYMNGTYENLTELYLDGNNLTGNIPPILNSKNLRYVNLQSNLLTGVLPVLNSSTAPNIEIFHVDQNQLFDVFGENQVGYLPHLWYYSASHNNITGNIPTDFFKKVPSLRQFDMSQNYLVGFLPTTLTSSLVTLDLQFNYFDNTLPPEWGDVGNADMLSKIWLNYNAIHGPIPENWKNLKNLKVLAVSHNQLSGKLPSFLQHDPSSSGLIFAGACNDFSDLPSWCVEDGSCSTCKPSHHNEDDLKYLWFLLIPGFMFACLVGAGLYYLIYRQRIRRSRDYSHIPEGTTPSKWQEL